MRKKKLTVQEILGSAIPGNLKEGIKEVVLKPETSPNFVEDLVFFRDHIYSPRYVFYPCCYVDISPVVAFPDSEIVLLDKEKPAVDALKGAGIEAIHADLRDHRRFEGYDLVILSNPQIHASSATHFIAKGGYVLANNYHSTVDQLRQIPGLTCLGSIVGEDREKKLVPNLDIFTKYVDFLGVFKRQEK